MENWQISNTWFVGDSYSQVITQSNSQEHDIQGRSSTEKRDTNDLEEK